LKAICIIPARKASSRFPDKLMQTIGGKSVIQWCYESVSNSGVFDAVYVATDDEAIMETIKSIGGKAEMVIGEFESGTDRVAALARHLEADIIVNVQGDTPFIKAEPLRLLVDTLRHEADVELASLGQPIYDVHLIQYNSVVKVVLDKASNAMYYSRSPIPFVRDVTQFKHAIKHIGVYAFKKAMLERFVTWAPSPLELIEKLECLRVLENGYKIRMIVGDYGNIEIDLPEHIAMAEDYLRKAKTP
jgi:3-deoxy-manno-octulosonate cytidylyltransferase (CMP-KDO synthetase)